MQDFNPQLRIFITKEVRFLSYASSAEINVFGLFKKNFYFYFNFFLGLIFILLMYYIGLFLYVELTFHSHLSSFPPVTHLVFPDLMNII